uniref:Cationic amino acid transporter-like protein n=1 Tax=Philodina roseola TaxID=96448 RepID=B6S379_PHIRO|nr:cationic amino acid transporter-like protein [Philodina roseola]
MPRKKFVVNALTNPDNERSANPVFSHLKIFVRRLIKTKSIAQLQEEAHEDNSFKRTLGPFQLLMLGVGSIIGTGIFVLSGQTAANFAGPAVILSFILAAIVAGLAAFSYAEMASMVPISGSAYSYTYAKYLAWIIGWDLVLEYLLAAATVAVGWSGYVVHFIETVSKHHATKWIVDAPISWNETAENFYTTGAVINLPAVAIVVALTILLLFGIGESAKANLIIVIIKIIVILLFIFACCAYVNPSNYKPFIPPNEGSFSKYGITGVLHGATVVFFAYIGFDSVTTTAQETKNPQRTLPIGIIGSLVISTVLYIAVCAVMVGLVPYTSLNLAYPISAAIRGTPHGVWLPIIIDLGAIAGLTSVTLVSLLGQSRVFYSMAHDGLLPPIFARVHARTKTPWISTIIIGIICAVVSAVFPLSVLGEMTSIGTLVAFFLVHISVMIMHFTHKDVPRGFRIPLGPWVIPPIGALLCLLLMITSSKETGIRLAVWLGIGQVIYFTYGYWNSKLRVTKRSSSTIVVVDPLAPMTEPESQTIENEYTTEMEVFNEKKF